MERTILVSLGLIFLMFSLGFYFHASLPERIASHWNADGAVDGFMGKTLGLFFLPSLVLVLLAFFLLVPRIDPLRENILAFRVYYKHFILLFVAFMFYIYCVTLAINLGFGLSINTLMSPALALLIFYAGVLMGKSRRNWFIGIRTPWTLSSDVVWDKTNRLGGKLFKASSVFILASVIAPNLMVYFVLFPLIASALFLVAYSYFEFQKLKG